MKQAILLTALVFTVLSACLGLTGCESKTESVKSASAEVLKPVAVTTATAVTREVASDFEETGTFVADESSDIAPVVAGRVLATPVDVGAHVAKGQVICELDHRDAQLRLEQAKALLAEATAQMRQMQSRIGWKAGTFDPTLVPEVAAARANYQSAQAQAKMAGADARRYANLVASGDVSKSAYEKSHTQQETAEAQANAARQQFEAASNGARQSYEMVSTSQAAVDSVKAQLAQAEKGLADTTIRAPFDGFITARPVAAGEYVALSNKIATIVRIGTVKLELQTPEQRAAQAHLGDKVIARVVAYPGRDFAGVVSAINQSVDPNSRAFILEARFNNPTAALKPGMFSTARVQQTGSVQAVFVPRAAVIRDKTTDSNQVFVIDNGKARLRVVQVGDGTADSIRIISGIAANEVVAVSNQNELFEGAVVTDKSVTGK
jgi:multidrug efflux pump subunit AcrA (membrane-fusion protein)